MRLSLSFLFRNNIASITAMLESVLPIVDEVVAVDTGSVDGTRALIEKVCSQYGAELKFVDHKDRNPHPRWISHFGLARQDGWAACTGDMILWLDTDDVLIGAKELREFINDTCDGEPRDDRVDVIAMLYDYQHDPWGRCTMRQKRDRVTRRGYMSWSDMLPVHEVLFPTRPGTYADDIMNFPFKVKHNVNMTFEQADEQSRRSSERNLWIIDRWIESGALVTSRIYYNRGDALRGLGRCAEAITAYTHCIERAPWGEELYDALLRRGDCHRLLSSPEQALDDYARASRTMPAYSAAWIGTAEVLLDQNRFKEALIWCNIADNAAGDERGVNWNPASRETATLFIAGRAHYGLQRWDEAHRCFEKILKLVPNHSLVKDMLAKTEGAVKTKQLHAAYMLVSDALEADGGEKLELWRKAVPKAIQAMPGLVETAIPPAPEGVPYLMIYCHHTVNLWGPTGLERGVGGSEEAVIEMSRGFAALGWHVEVYGMPPVNEVGRDENGVWWFPFYAASAGRKPDVFVGWRDTRYMTIGTDAGQRYLWLQDIPSPEWYTQDFIDSVDGVLCISAAQANHLPDRCVDKTIITGNGIDPAKCVDGPNHANRFIYCSSPDRGLMQVLLEWPKIKAAIPDAILDVYYGFRDAFMAGIAQSQSWLNLKSEIERLAQQPGVIWHGMVGVTELHQAMAHAGFWLYPTSFEESYCTNAAKVMAMGAIPVTSRYSGSSLPEVCGLWDLGPEDDSAAMRIENDPERLDAWTERVIQLSLSNADLSAHRASMKDWARTNLTWNARVEQWNSLFSEKLAQRALLPETATV